MYDHLDIRKERYFDQKLCLDSYCCYMSRWLFTN